jgi:hypothetical protein
MRRASKKIAMSLLAGVLLLLALVSSVDIASAGRGQSGNIIATFNGGISPRFLPRLRATPAIVRLSSSFETDDGRPLPRLRRISIGMSSRGRIVTAGLPLCPAPRIRATKASQALSACGAARVGHGVMWLNTAIPGQRSIPVKGRMLLFNGRLGHGRRAVLADVHTKSPPTSFVMPFLLRHNASGTEIHLIATVPRTAGTWARINSLNIVLGRRYSYRGRVRSFVEASCFAPPRFTGITFPLAHARYTFAGGRSVRATADSACGVKR